MKKILIAASLFFMANFSFAQTAKQIAKPGTYVIDSNYNKFVGTWRWTSGKDTVTIVFQKQKLLAPPPLSFYSDNLIGWHTYIKNGKLVESSMSHVNTPYNVFSTMIFGSVYTPTNIRGVFEDITNHKSGDLFFAFLANSTTQAQWTLQESEGVRVNLPGQPVFITGFTLPTSMVLKKIK